MGIKEFFFSWGSAPSRRREPRDTGFGSEVSRADISQEYLALAEEQLARFGLSRSSYSLEARSPGTATDGRSTYAVMVSLTQWERRNTPRLLLGVPLLEQMMRKALKATWLDDLSHFGGIWLHASAAAQSSDALHEAHTLTSNLDLAADRAFSTGFGQVGR